MSWRYLIGDFGIHLGVETFGASADHKTLFDEYGLTVDRVVATALELAAPPQTPDHRHEAPPAAPSSSKEQP